jgi:hypothetical protein
VIKMVRSIRALLIRGIAHLSRQKPIRSGVGEEIQTSPVACFLMPGTLY